ncbi:DUF1616 domain-containing protein [Haloarcula onubensis]|uniref:DUF1616 domain-containing protein n=1 Tax=Haloarcula onubensis TaxID=2950539 RepID=A0ABU2FKD4_9EURY|nr:DUF1616 domain-containing protein [Halomicroarcula sp. S3CR25-11]MDS0280772.1 DUF1616 domain-containing protein [Halomicroarcula sp. S3CR25-11]
MASRRPVRVRVPVVLRELPADLAAVLGLVVLTNLVVFLPVVRETPLRIAFGLPLTLFLPGYALVAALFPEAGESPTDETTDPPPTADAAGTATDGEDGTMAALSDRGIDGIERVALSFGLSIAVVPLIGLVLNFTPWGIRLVPIMVAVSGFTVSMVVLAAQRRRELPAEERFSVPYRQWLDTGRAELLEPDTRADAILNVVLVCSILLATGSVAYAVAVPKQGESFSEFYLLTENESGDLVADDYPTEFQPGESRQLTVGIGNQEHERANYTVVVELQRVDVVDNETRVREATELRRFRPTLAHNETWHRQHTLTPRMTGERLRLQYLLYRGEPATPLNRSAAYREVHLWVTVTDGAADNSSLG